jgi:hypothetical protein
MKNFTTHSRFDPRSEEENKEVPISEDLNSPGTMYQNHIGFQTCTTALISSESVTENGTLYGPHTNFGQSRIGTSLAPLKPQISF